MTDQQTVAQSLFNAFKESEGPRRARILSELQEMGYHVDGDKCYNGETDRYGNHVKTVEYTLSRVE